MKTRVGKIARLPQQIRETLNQRLADGERGRTLVQWLNALPEVQKLITEEFSGLAIREQNLSEWRKGGFVEWLQHQELRRRARWIVEQGNDLGVDEGDNDLSESLAFLVTAELMVQVQELNAIADPKERWRRFREVARELSRVRRDDQRYRRAELRRWQWQSTLEPEEEENPSAELPTETTEKTHENLDETSPINQPAQAELRPDPT